jgi:predicted ATPase
MIRRYGAETPRVSGGYRMIEKLEIRNFRCFKHVQLSGLKTVNVVVGENGCGKTTFLEALFFAAGGSPEIYQRTRAWRGYDPVVPSEPEQVGLLMFRDAFYNFAVEAGIEIAFTDSEMGSRSLRIFPDGEQHVTLPLEKSSSDVAVLQDLQFQWKTASGKEYTGRIELDVEKKELRMPRIAESFPMIFLNIRTIQNASQNADRYSDLSKRNEEESILKAVKAIYPHVFELNVLSEGGRSSIYASIDSLDEKLPVGFISAGLNKYLSILLAVAFRKKGVVLVDEMENGFYYKKVPEMMSSIFDSCRAKEVQLFMTTHSLEFLRALLPSIKGHEKEFCLLRLEKRNGTYDVVKFDGDKFEAALEEGIETPSIMKGPS